MRFTLLIAFSLVPFLVTPAVAICQDTAYLFAWNGTATEVYAFPFPPESPLQQTLVLTLEQDVQATAVDPSGGLHVVIRSDQGDYQLHLLDIDTGTLTYELRLGYYPWNRWDIAYDDDGRLWLIDYPGYLYSVDQSTGAITEASVPPEDVSLYCLARQQGLLFAGGSDVLSFDPVTHTSERLTEPYSGPTDMSTYPVTLTSDGADLWGVYHSWSLWGGVYDTRLWYIRTGEWDNLYLSSQLDFLDWDVSEVRGFELLRRQQAAIPTLAPTGVALLAALLLVAAVLLIRLRA